MCHVRVCARVCFKLWVGLQRKKNVRMYVCLKTLYIYNNINKLIPYTKVGGNVRI
jgi:hypothetical protein